MRYRLLGASGLRVSEIFLGAMTFSDDFAHGADRREARRIVDAYADAGGNVVDTAVNYRGGASEEIVGEVLEGRRERFVVATKYSVTRDPSDPNASGNSRKNLRASLETSLRRLRTDHVDLLYVHIWDPGTPIEETMRALDDAVRDGKVLYVGVSDAPGWVVGRANTLAELRGLTPFVALQVPYSLVRRDIERELLPAAEALGLTVAAWAPLAGGLLTGRFAGGAVPGEATRVVAARLDARDRAAADVVAEVAADLGASSSQVAIAWTRARSRRVHPVVGVRTLEQLNDNLGALDVRLDAAAMERLEGAVAFDRGFPMDFIESMRGFVHGDVADRVDLGR